MMCEVMICELMMCELMTYHDHDVAAVGRIKEDPKEAFDPDGADTD